MSHHFEKCRRYAGPLKSSHFLFDLDKFQEIQLLTRNLSKAQTQQYLAEHLKTTVAPMSSLHCFSWKDHENSLFQRQTNSFNNNSEKCKLKNVMLFLNFCFPHYIFHLLAAQIPESTKYFLSQSTFCCMLWYCGSPHKLDVAEKQKKSLASCGTYRGFVLGVVLAVGRGPQFHYTVRQFSPPEPAPFKTCYHNSRISPR